MASVLELEVATRVYGGDNPRETTLVAFPHPQLPLREVIALKVQAEVERRQRQRDGQGQVSLSLRYLTDEDLAWARGGAIKRPQARPVSAAAEVERALDAFAQRRFFVLVDGTRVSDLEELLSLTPETKLQFVRLLPLVGGGRHDWTYLLTETGLIAHTAGVARAIFLAGSAVIFWSLWLIIRDARTGEPFRPG